MAQSPNQTMVSNHARSRQATLAPGYRLGKYRIERLIGKGGMAEVYLARHDLMRGSVAIKVLLPELAIDEDMVKRFKGEANAAYDLRHPNIIRIHYVDEANGIYYFSMDFIEGRTLANILSARGKLSESESLDYARQICRALTEAHSHNLVHRDIKPSNIMVTETGNVIVTDFGIAKDWTKETTITQFGVAVCTPRYASPEQKAVRSVDGRSDIFSLGVLMFEMATGKVPTQVLDKASEANRPVNPRALEPELSSSFANLVMKAIEPRPEKRFASAAEMLEVLDRVIEGATFHYKPARPRSWKIALTVGIGLLILGGLAAAWFAGGNQWVHRPADSIGITQAQKEKAQELIKQARAYLQSHQPNKAEAMFVLALKNDPASEEPLEGLRLVQNLREDLRRGEARLAAAKNQAKMEQRLAAQKAELEAKAATLALKQREAALALSKASAEKDRQRAALTEMEKKAKELCHQGERAADQNRFAQARQLWKQALEVYPDYQVALGALDSLPERERLYQQELQIASRQVALAQKTKELNRRTAESSANSAKAVKVKPNPASTNAVVEQAMRAAEKGNYGLALNMLKMVLTLDPDSDLAKRKMAEIKLMQQKNN